MLFLKNNNLISPKHALFDVSKFTYPGRNGVFLNLVGLWKRPLEKVFLLGSGPIEPFEIASLPCYSDSVITAIDCDSDVYNIICNAIKSGQLDIKNLARVCRSSDSENRYLLDSDLMYRQLCKIKKQGWQADLNRDLKYIETLYINRKCTKQLNIILCNLQKDIPMEINDADLIFEGFMLINWIKSKSTISSSEKFLNILSHKMSLNAWFASATSITHFLNQFPGSKPLLRQTIAAGLLPTAGIMVRWAVNSKSEITSQFGSVFRKSRTIDERLYELGNSFENDTSNMLLSMGVQHIRETIDYNALPDLFEKGDILSFRAVDDRSFSVIKASWSQLSRQCIYKDIPYELKIDNQDESA